MSFLSYLGIIFWFISFSVCHFMQYSFIFELLLLLLLIFCFVLRQDPTLTQAGLKLPMQTKLALDLLWSSCLSLSWDYSFIYAQTSGLQIVLFLKCLTRTHAHHKQALPHGQWCSRWKMKALLVRLAARQCWMTWMTEMNPLMAGRLSKEGPGGVKDWKRSPSNTVDGCLLLYPPRPWREIGFSSL